MLLTACDSSSTTVDRLYQKQGKNISYVIDVKMSDSNNRDVYFKSYIKGDKWKTIFLDKNNRVHSIHSYNGGDKLYSYNVSTKKIKETFVEEEFRHKNALNIVGPMVYWKKPIGMSALDFNPKVIRKNETINNQPCAMIKFGRYREACISNESGIAVYLKFEDKRFYLENAKQVDIADNLFENPKKIK